MKLSYQLNVSVSDGVFTNTAQVSQPRSIWALGLVVDLDFRAFVAFTRKNPGMFFSRPLLQMGYTHAAVGHFLLAAALLCSLELMCIYVILDLL